MREKIHFLILCYFLFTEKDVHVYAQTFEYNLQEPYINKIKITMGNDSTYSDSLFLYLDLERVRDTIQSINLAESQLSIKNFLVFEYANFRFNKHKNNIESFAIKPLSDKEFLININSSISADRERKTFSIANLKPVWVWKSDGVKKMISLYSETILKIDGNVASVPLDQIRLLVSITLKQLKGIYNLNPFQPNFDILVDQILFQKEINLSKLKHNHPNSLIAEFYIKDYQLNSDGTNIYLLLFFAGKPK